MFINNNKIAIYLLTIVLFFSNGINGNEQNNYTVKGKVTTKDGISIYNAHIAIPALSRGTTSNNEGNFTLSKLPKGSYQLIISHIGYETSITTIILESEKTVEIEISLIPVALKTETVVVTGNPIATSSLESPLSISTLSGREKMENESSSLGKTLESMPGIYNLSTGSVSGKPVVRGHTSERVLILSDGTAQEYQQYGERHMPNLESFSYDRIEVIKGASSLLYGSDAIGGAVNLIPHPFHFSHSDAIGVEGSVHSGYYSNSNEYMIALDLNTSTELFSFKGNIIKRKSDNFNTPDVLPYSVTLKNGDPKFTGEINYTNFEQLNGSFGVGYLSPWGVISADYNKYANKNNFLLPDGKPIGLKLDNQNFNLRANLPFSSFIIKPKFSYQNNHRIASRAGLDYNSLPDSASVDLNLSVYAGRLDIEHVNVFDLTGTIGMEVKYYDHKNEGKVPLQPTGHFTNAAVYLFEEMKINKLSINFGGRFDYRTQEFFGTTTNPLLLKDDSRSYKNFAASIGASYRISNKLLATANLGRGFRTPSFFNLYVYGEHGGVFAFQIGNPDLKNEISVDLSSSLRLHNTFINAEFTLYHNIISNYIYLYNAPNHPLAPVGKPFVFAHSQADARLTGIELSAEATLTDWLIINGNYSMINSEFSSGEWTGDELPLMPPDRISIGMKVLFPNVMFLEAPYFTANVKFVSSKNAAGMYEPFGQFDDGIGPNIPYGVASTGSYNLTELGLGFDINLYNQPINFHVTVTNLFDKSYRDFLDTYKGYALAPGRSINAKVKIPFGN